MDDLPFLLHSRAFAGYYTLTRSEQEALQAAIAPLLDLPEAKWPTVGAIRLESPEPIYMLKVDDSLRAFVQPTPEGKVELLDLVRHETLELYFNEAEPAKAGKPTRTRARR